MITHDDVQYYANEGDPKSVIDEFDHRPKYDFVIREASDIDDLLNDITGATRIAIVGTITYNGNINIPSRVRVIDGYKDATIKFTNVDSNFAFGYTTQPTDTYSRRITNLTIVVSSGNADAISNCVNLVNCRAAARGNKSAFSNCARLINCSGWCTSDDIGYTFYNCRNLVNCKGVGNTVAGKTGRAYTKCAILTNCDAIANENGGPGYGFSGCNRLSSCIVVSTSGSSTENLIGFDNSQDIVGCEVSLQGVHGLFGMQNCENISGCKVTITATNQTGLSTFYGMHNCKQISACNITVDALNTTIQVYGLYNCTNVSGCGVQVYMSQFAASESAGIYGTSYVSATYVSGWTDSSHDLIIPWSNCTKVDPDSCNYN